MGSGRYTLHVAAARDPSRRFGVARPRGIATGPPQAPAHRSALYTYTSSPSLATIPRAALGTRTYRLNCTVLRSLRQDVDHSKHITGCFLVVCYM